MFRTIFVGGAILAAILCTGCASIVGGQNQSISVTTANSDGNNVDGAKCNLQNDKGSWYATTPGSVTVRRSYGDLLVTCKLDGAGPGTASVKSTTKALAFGNVVFGGVIGVAVDTASGAAYDYPTSIRIAMPVGAAAASAATNVASRPATVLNDKAAYALAAGTMFVFQDSEPVSGASQGESMFVVSDLNANGWSFNRGSIVAKLDGTPIRGQMHGAMIYGAGPREIVQGGSWEGRFLSTGAEPVPVTLTLLDRQARSIAGRQFSAARLQVEGHAPRTTAPGTGGSVNGAPINGEMLVDADTGLVLSLSVKSRHSGYAVRRELVRIAVPEQSTVAPVAKL
jgi:hypothetical protein